MTLIKRNDWFYKLAISSKSWCIAIIYRDEHIWLVFENTKQNREHDGCSNWNFPKIQLPENVRIRRVEDSRARVMLRPLAKSCKIN